MTVTQQRIGIVGVGVIGGAMASSLLRNGYEVIIQDIDQNAVAALVLKGATAVATPAELAQKSDVIFTSLPSLQSIESVFLGKNGIVSELLDGQVVFETSTNSPDLIKRLHEAISAKGGVFLDAPVSGGAKGARRGRMAFWVGGDKATYERFEPVLRAMGDKPIYVGPVGSGLITKLVHNCISQATQAAIAETFVMGVRAGAEPLALWAAIRQGSIGRRRTFDGMADEFLPARFDPPNASLAIVEKDLMLATQLGRDLRAPLRFANLALADITEAINRGWGTRDARSVMILPQERAGVSIKVDPARIEEVFREDPPAPGDAKHGSGS